MKKYIFILLFFCWNFVLSTPEISLWTNNPCFKCHINIQGGGQRNHFGKNFATNSSIAIIDTNHFFYPISNFLLQKLKFLNFPYQTLIKKTQENADSIFYYGFDFRIQSARSHKGEEAKRKFFPMQGSIYLGSTPLEWFTLEGQYNFGPKVFQGQKEWAASTIFNFGKDLPVLRLGFFQPTFGIRDCDMTSLDRRVPFPDGTENLFAPDYAEYGLEINYMKNDWFSAAIGVFDDKSLNEVLIDNKNPIVEKNKPSYSGRIMIYPSWLNEDFYDSYIGLGGLYNGNFIYFNAFAGIALIPEVHFYSKYIFTTSDKIYPYSRTVNSFQLGLNYIPYKGVIIGFRGESGNANWNYTTNDFNIRTTQLILNAKLLVVPMLELIPEYRWLITEEYSSSRWAFQIHLYY